ncbi:hypothetical protein GCM10023084_62040 [Streptomyces lacrimifluminis]|uniref:Uncharacterized protein n=1 Tax=Streptomyces lacrimifluminis TaxID=1500077 RepID=A0A917NZN2_9ACTN|nr:hypothetical protein GCM10012282_46880 [Streptomyces lacrimifluminis]
MVQAQDFAERIEYPGRRVDLPPLFETPVVVDADAGEHGHLLAPQADDPAPSVDGKTERLRGELRTPAAHIVAGR